MDTPKPSIWIVASVEPQTGGMETYVRQLLNSRLAGSFQLKLFDISKPQVRVRQSKKYTGYDAILKRSLWLTALSFGQSFWFVLKFALALVRHPIDIIHIHTASYTSFWEKTLYITLCVWAQKPVVLHIHGALFDQFYRRRGRVFKRIIRFFLNKCDRIMVLSEHWQKIVSQWTDPAKIIIVPNGTNVSWFVEKQFQKSASPAVLFLGELSIRKGIHDLLATLPQIKSQIPDLHVYIAGPGDVNDISDTHLYDKEDHDVFFLGPVFDREKLQLLQSCWVYVLPSYAEGQPMAIIEAMASGLTVVSTQVGGIPEMLQDIRGNVLLSPGDRDALAKALIQLLTDQVSCERIGADNQAWARSHYDISINMTKIEECYLDLL